MFSKLKLFFLIFILSTTTHAMTKTFQCQEEGRENYVLILTYETPDFLGRGLGTIRLIDSSLGETVYKNELLITEHHYSTRCGSIYTMGGKNEDGDIISIKNDFVSQACGGQSSYKKEVYVNGLSCY